MKQGKYTLVPYVGGKAQIAEIFPDDILEAATQAQDLMLFEGKDGVAILAPTISKANPVGMRVIQCLGDCGKITAHFQKSAEQWQRILLTGDCEAS